MAAAAAAAAAAPSVQQLRHLRPGGSRAAGRAAARKPASCSHACRQLLQHSIHPASFAAKPHAQQQQQAEKLSRPPLACASRCSRRCTPSPLPAPAPLHGLPGPTGHTRRAKRAKGRGCWWMHACMHVCRQRASRGRSCPPPPQELGAAVAATPAHSVPHPLRSALHAQRLNRATPCTAPTHPPTSSTSSALCFDSVPTSSSQLQGGGGAAGECSDGWHVVAGEKGGGSRKIQRPAVRQVVEKEGGNRMIRLAGRDHGHGTFAPRSPQPRCAPWPPPPAAGTTAASARPLPRPLPPTPQPRVRSNHIPPQPAPPPSAPLPHLHSNSSRARRLP